LLNSLPRRSSIGVAAVISINAKRPLGLSYNTSYALQIPIAYL
jgi:hypothetical protein